MSWEAARSYCDIVWQGWLENRKNYRELPGGGSIRPSDGLELCLRLAEIEESCGSIDPARIDPGTWEMISKFARWTPDDRDGQLAALLVDQCRKLLS